MHPIPLETVPDVDCVPHGWTMAGDRLVVVASIDVDVDGMPRHTPYSYFGTRREDMAPGPVRIAFALSVDADGRMATHRLWDAGGRRLFEGPSDWSAWALGGGAAFPAGTSVAAPFTVPVAILASAGLVDGTPDHVTNTRELVAKAHGGEAALAYDEVARRAAAALREILGEARVGRLARLTRMAWFPSPGDTATFNSELPDPHVDALIGAGDAWPFLRRSLMADAALRAGPAPLRPPSGCPSPLDLALEALGPTGTRAHLRRLSAVGQRLTPGREGFLASLPVDWLPPGGTDPAWEPLLRIAENLSTPSLAADVPGGTVMRDSKGRWAEYERRLVEAALPDAEGGDIPAVAAHLADMRMAFERMLLRPAVDALGGEGAARVRTRGLGAQRVSWRLLLGHGGLLSLAERSGRYHRRREAMRATLRGLDPGLFVDLAWPAHLPAWHDPATGLDVVPLTDETALRAEGAGRGPPGSPEGLAHCVGDYGWPCAEGRSRILSVRRPRPDGFTRLSTAEVNWTAQGPRVRQHSGRANGAPPAEASVALDAYMARLEVAGPRTPPPRDGRARPDPRVASAGYDVTKASNVAHALALWRPMLPKPLRREGLRGFVDAARVLLEEMDAPDARGGLSRGR